MYKYKYRAAISLIFSKEKWFACGWAVDSMPGTWPTYRASLAFWQFTFQGFVLENMSL